MAVIATAGHVDHGKSALVRALTGVDPDTLDEEKRRGLTLELGHVHLRLGPGWVIGIVDVPGHERYLGTALSGVGPAGAVLLCVAADEGWSPQTEQHARALVALGAPATALVVTKTDRADPGLARADAVARLSALGLVPSAVVGCSARTGAGLDEVREVIRALADLCPVQRPGGEEPVRLWVDRSFTVRGSGTVVTGTLPSGTVHRGQRLATPAGPVRVRGLQRYGQRVETVSGPSRVALNLAGVTPMQVGRGDAVLGGWAGAASDRFLADRTMDHGIRRWPATTLVTVGTATLAARISLRGDRAVIRFPRLLPLQPGDRVVVRDPGGREILGGLAIVGAAPARPGVLRRGAMAASRPTPRAETPLTPGEHQLLAHLARDPLRPADPGDLLVWGVDGAALRGLGISGRLTYLGSGLAFGAQVSPAAREALARLPMEFTVSQARQALGLSRALTLRLLEHLDGQGVTARVTTDLRILVR